MRATLHTGASALVLAGRGCVCLALRVSRVSEASLCVVGRRATPTREQGGTPRFRLVTILFYTMITITQTMPLSPSAPGCAGYGVSVLALFVATKAARPPFAMQEDAAAARQLLHGH